MSLTTGVSVIRLNLGQARSSGEVKTVGTRPHAGITGFRIPIQLWRLFNYRCKLNGNFCLHRVTLRTHHQSVSGLPGYRGIKVVNTPVQCRICPFLKVML